MGISVKSYVSLEVDRRTIFQYIKFLLFTGTFNMSPTEYLLLSRMHFLLFMLIIHYICQKRTKQCTLMSIVYNYNY